MKRSACDAGLGGDDDDQCSTPRAGLRGNAWGGDVPDLTDSCIKRLVGSGGGGGSSMSGLSSLLGATKQQQLPPTTTTEITPISGRVHQHQQQAPPPLSPVLQRLMASPTAWQQLFISPPRNRVRHRVASPLHHRMQQQLVSPPRHVPTAAAVQPQQPQQPQQPREWIHDDGGELPPLYQQPQPPPEQTQAAYLAEYARVQQMHTSVLDAPKSLFVSDSAELAKHPRLYMYLCDMDDMHHLVFSAYTFSGLAWSVGTGMSLLSRGKNTIFNNKTRAAVVSKTLNNTVAFLPVQSTLSPPRPDDGCETLDDTYRLDLAGHLVLLACEDPARGGRESPDGIVCLGIGVFMGDRLYANTLDPEYRVRARIDTLTLGDPNMLLAPVHFLTALVGDGSPLPPTLAALGCLFTENTVPADALTPVPAPLEQVCGNVRLMLCLAAEHLHHQLLSSWVMAAVLQRGLHLALAPQGKHKESEARRAERVRLVQQHLQLPVTAAFDEDDSVPPTIESATSNEMGRRKVYESHTTRNVLQRAAAEAHEISCLADGKQRLHALHAMTMTV